MDDFEYEFLIDTVKSYSQGDMSQQEMGLELDQALRLGFGPCQLLNLISNLGCQKAGSLKLFGMILDKYDTDILRLAYTHHDLFVRVFAGREVAFTLLMERYVQEAFELRERFFLSSAIWKIGSKHLWNSLRELLSELFSPPKLLERG